MLFTCLTVTETPYFSKNQRVWRGSYNNIVAGLSLQPTQNRAACSSNEGIQLIGILLKNKNMPLI
jgi:hypothetical protein